MENTIINFGNVEEVLKEIDETFEHFKLNLDEKILMIKYLNDRLIQQKNKVDGQKLVDAMNPMSIIKRAMGKKDDGDT